MKNVLKLIVKLIVTGCLAAVGVQAGVVWDDSFDGASLNANLTEITSAQGSVTQTGEQLQMFISTNSPSQRAKVVTSSGQNGETEFAGAALYDFTDHQVSARFDIASFTGTPDSGPNFNAFHVGIGELNASGNVTNGVSIDLVNRNGAYRFELDGFGATINPSLNGQPSAFEFDLDGSNLTLRVEGTTFTTDSDTYTWTFNSGTAASYALMFGAYNSGTPVAGTQVTLDSFKVWLAGDAGDAKDKTWLIDKMVGVRPNYEYTEGGIGIDASLKQLIENPLEWKNVLNNVDFLSLPSHAFVNCSDETLIGFKNLLTSNNLQLEVLVGGIRDTTPTIVGNGIHEAQNKDIPRFQRYYNLGGTIDWLHIDSAIEHASTNPDWNATVDQITTELVNYISTIQQTFPQIEVGLFSGGHMHNWDGMIGTDPDQLPAEAGLAGQRYVLDSLAQKLDASGLSLAFFRTGYPYPMEDLKLRGNKLRAMQDYAEAQGWPFSFAYSSKGTYADDVYHEKLLESLYEELLYGIDPGMLCFQSWTEAPRFLLGELDEYTFMYNARRFYVEKDLLRNTVVYEDETYPTVDWALSGGFSVDSTNDISTPSTGIACLTNAVFSDFTLTFDVEYDTSSTKWVGFQTHCGPILGDYATNCYWIYFTPSDPSITFHKDGRLHRKYLASDDGTHSVEMTVFERGDDQYVRVIVDDEPLVSYKGERLAPGYIQFRSNQTAGSFQNIQLGSAPISFSNLVSYATLTYSAGGNGSISGTSPQTVQTGGSGTAVTAVPNTGYHFVDWSDTSTQNPRTDVDVRADVTVTANFAINTYTLTYTAGANGSISGTSPQNVNHGASGTAVTAVPDADYIFVDWSDGSTQNPRTDLSVTADVNVTANFESVFPLADLAGSENTAAGTVSGSLVDTDVIDDIYEVLTEEADGTPTSLLEHQWMFDVYGGELVTFYVEAHHSANAEGDDFVFAYSTNGTEWVDMVTVVKTADDDSVQSFALPSGLSGTVYVRVVDADRTAGNSSLDSLYVDGLFIVCDQPTSVSTIATSPVPADGATNVALNPVLDWLGGSQAASHDVYFGTNPNPGAGEFQGNLPMSGFAPGVLAYNTTYYWAINEVNSLGTTPGAVWSFTTTAAPNQSPAFNADPLSKANATVDAAYSSSIAADASDPESDPMTFSKVSGPVWLSVASDGTLSGTPGAGDIGLNSFSVQVDAAGGSDTAILELTVDAAPTWSVLNSEDFESGWGIWNDPGLDCRRNSKDAAYAHSGSFCVRIRDNSETSNTTTDDLNLSAYNSLKIEFWFVSRSMANGDSFNLQVRDANNVFQTVATYVGGTDFTNIEMTFKSVEVSSAQVSFGSASQVRFECESAEDRDRVFLDDIVLSVK